MDILKLFSGYRAFHKEYFENPESLYQKYLKTGQAPKAMIIACSDSRSDPAMLFGAAPGDIFVIRNVAALVPPYERQGRHHGVSSAIEFGIRYLHVEDVIVMGHRQCGGIGALMSNDKHEHDSDPSHFIDKWMSIADKAKEKVIEEMGPATNVTEMNLLRKKAEKEAVVVSLQNLRTFPFVQDEIRERDLRLHGAIFDLESGELLLLDEKTGEFEAIPTK